MARALSEGMAELGAVGAGGRRVRCLIRPDESPRYLDAADVSRAALSGAASGSALASGGRPASVSAAGSALGSGA